MTSDEKNRMEHLVEKIQESYVKWKSIESIGSVGDMFWTDGSNMNLLSSEISYFQKYMEDVIQDNFIEYPIEYYYELPKEVDDNYMTVPRVLQKDRWKA